MKIPVHNLSGKKVGEATLDKDVFGCAHNADLLQQVYTAQAANRRSGSAHTKIRSDRRGGGKKPWKQKGTGNARTGSTRNPIWRKGGVIFGPLKEKNFSKNINVKMKRKALCIALSDKVRSNNVVLVDEIALKENKTKEFDAALGKLKITQSLLVGFAPEERKHNLALRNIPRAAGLPAEQLNVFDVMNAEKLLLSKDAVKTLQEQHKAEVKA